MNGYQRIQAALRGEQPDHPPVMLHHFMHAAREAHVTMAEFRQDPRALARSFMQSIEKYALDGVMVDVDTAALAGALGVAGGVSCRRARRRARRAIGEPRRCGCP